MQTVHTGSGTLNGEKEIKHIAKQVSCEIISKLNAFCYFCVKLVCMCMSLSLCVWSLATDATECIAMLQFILVPKSISHFVAISYPSSVFPPLLAPRTHASNPLFALPLCVYSSACVSLMHFHDTTVSLWRYSSHFPCHWQHQQHTRSYNKSIKNY